MSVEDLQAAALGEVLADVWDAGLSAGADLGMGIGEAAAGIRRAYPPVPSNPYRADGGDRG